MSTFAAGVIASKRAGAEASKSSAADPPGVKTYVDALAALVPAEALSAHAVVLGFCTTTKKDPQGKSYTAISDPTTLKWSFVALLLLCPVLFLAGRKVGTVAGKKPPGTLVTIQQCVIPVLALIAWAMLQKTTAFDAWAPSWSAAARDSIAVIGAIVLGLWAGGLGYKLDKANPAAA